MAVAAVFFVDVILFREFLVGPDLRFIRIGRRRGLSGRHPDIESQRQQGGRERQAHKGAREDFMRFFPLLDHEPENLLLRYNLSGTGR